MNNLDATDIFELIERYNHLIKIYIPLTAEVAEKVEKFGKMRQELQIISAEFIKRGYNPDIQESLFNMIQEEIKKRNISIDGNTPPDKNEGHT